MEIKLHHGMGGGPPWHREGGGPPWHREGGRRGGWFMQPPVWGFLQPCLLLLLAEGPQHGYSLMEELQRRQLLGSDVDVGNLYRTLRRLEAERLVESAWSEPGPGPNKRVYQITERGKELLQQWAGALEERTRIINRFLDEYHRIYASEAPAPPDNLRFTSDEDNPI